jgi:signal transduction histidine kinase
MAQKGMHFELELPDESAPAVIDREALDQILDNLLSNAAKFSPAGSTITLALLAVGASWQFEVRDEGPGIPEMERSALFRKFHRGTNRPTGGEASAGMGLFIVKSLVESLGGSVAYLPRSPGGAIFRVVLPK